MPPHRSADTDELRPVTALFADVVGSTALGERLDAAEVKAVIGECVTRMCEAVETFGGHITGQMGDGIAAFFGLHAAHEDDAVRAARAAIEIQGVVATYAKEVREAWDVKDLNVRIGLNSGRVAAGPVGARDETVIALGDAVNVAARLQAAARPGGIVVGAALAETLAERFVFDELGALSVKGRVEPVEAYELVSVGRRPDTRLGGLFVGRSRELDEATASVIDLQSGRGQVLTIVGDGGIGKSRLLAELCDRAPSDVVWLRATCDPLDHRLPYDPLEQMLRSFLGVDRGVNGIQLRVRFRAVMQDVLGERFQICAPQLARILGIELEKRLMGQLDGLPHEVLTKGLHNAIADWLDALSQRNPVVLAIDNLHDAREPLADVIASLIERLERLPILLVLTLRPDPKSPAWRTRVDALSNHSQRCRDLALRPLDDDSSYELVSALDAAASLNGRLRELVVGRAEGNPLYIEQLVAAIGTEGESPTDPVPRALESFLLSRIDALSTSAKQALQAAAVLGRVFAEGVLASMAPEGFDSAISELLRADLITEHRRLPRQFSFRHGLLRDAALSTLTPNRLNRLHRSAADAIEMWLDYDVERHGQDLARHLMASGESDRAAECLETLGDRLALVYRDEEAIEAFGRTLEMLRIAGLWGAFSRVTCKQAPLLGATGHAAAAVALVDEALAREIDPTVATELVLSKAERLAEADRFDDVEPLLDRLLEGGQQANTVGRALVLRGRLALERQDLAVAELAAQQLDRLTGVSRDIAFERASLHGGIAATNGDFAAAESHVLDAQSVADELGHLPKQLIARRRAGLILRLLGLAREAYETLLIVFEKYREIGYVVGQLETAVNLMSCAVLCGELDSGRRIGELTLLLAQEPAWRAMVLVNLVSIEAERGDLERTEVLIAEIAALEAVAPPWASFIRRLHEAHLDQERGNLEMAGKRMNDLLETESLRGREGDVGFAAAFHAEIADALGDRELALLRVAQAMAKTDSADSCAAVQIERMCASVIASDDPVLAEKRLHSALVSARRSGLRIEEAECLVAIARMNDSNRKQLLDDARSIFEVCGCGRGLVALDRWTARLLDGSAV